MAHTRKGATADNSLRGLSTGVQVELREPAREGESHRNQQPMDSRDGC